MVLMSTYTVRSEAKHFGRPLTSARVRLGLGTAGGIEVFTCTLGLPPRDAQRARTRPKIGIGDPQSSPISDATMCRADPQKRHFALSQELVETNGDIKWRRVAQSH